MPAYTRRLARFLIIIMWKILKKKTKTMATEKEINIEDATVNAECADGKTADNSNEEATADKDSCQEADKMATSDTETDNKAEQPEESPLQKAERELEEAKKLLLYKTAEFENYRKRTLKEKAELILNGGEKTIAAILPVLDDFERALADKSEDPAVIKEGMQMIHNKFSKALESLGVKKIETQDQDFNTDYHEAIAMVPGMGDDKKGKVIDCVQTGYTLNEKVIRHAKVAVGQ